MSKEASDPGAPGRSLTRLPSRLQRMVIVVPRGQPAPRSARPRWRGSTATLRAHPTSSRWTRTTARATVIVRHAPAFHPAPHRRAGAIDCLSVTAGFTRSSSTATYPGPQVSLRRGPSKSQWPPLHGPISGYRRLAAPATGEGDHHRCRARGLLRRWRTGFPQAARIGRGVGVTLPRCPADAIDDPFG
jgi:hypothetical protein